MSTTETSVIINPDITARSRAILEWLDRLDTRVTIDRAISNLRQEVTDFITSDTSLRIPRQKELRENSFRLFLDLYLDQKLTPLLRSLRRVFPNQLYTLFIETPSPPPNVTLNHLNRYLREFLWPEVEAILRQHTIEILMNYALRGLTMTWLSRTVATEIPQGIPQRTAEGWNVNLLHPKTRTVWGKVHLSTEGEILSSAEDLRRQLEAVS